MKDDRRTIHMEADVHRRLKALASLKGVSVASVVEDAVQEYILNHLGEKA